MQKELADSTHAQDPAATRDSTSGKDERETLDDERITFTDPLNCRRRVSMPCVELIEQEEGGSACKFLWGLLSWAGPRGGSSF